MLKIYKASAGSGKTYTLAYEYILALLGIKNPETKQYRLNHQAYASEASRLINRHRHILAITFTNKATDEMKRRIVDELDALSHVPQRGADDANYAERLCLTLKCSREHLAESAGMALSELLNTYTDFNVTTIDAFFQRVLRTFARELDRQGDFSVELNDMVAVQEAVHTMLDDYNKDPSAAPELGRWLLSFMLQQVEEGKKANFMNRDSHLHATLVEVLSRISDERFKAYAADMRRYLGLDDGEEQKDGDPHTNKLQAVTTLLHAMLDDIIKQIAAKANSTVKELEAKGITEEQFSKGKTYTRFLFVDLPAGKILTKREIHSNTICKVIDGETSPVTKARFTGNEGDLESVRATLRFAYESYIRYFDIKHVLTALNQLSLLTYTWRFLDELVTGNNTVLLSDTNHMLSRIIGSDETPFIYERLGVQLRHFLIDEFQDTSRMQWENLRPLIAQSMSERYDCLIIGDEKQSIYRFRNSDSSLLHTQVPDVDFPAPAYDTKVHGSAPGENTNYRSAADVVKFNNTLFTSLAAIYGVEGFENVVQDIPSSHLHLQGYVRFVPVEKGNNDGDDDSKDRAIDLMLEEMTRQHDEGGYSWSDMAVLVNRNKEGAYVIERMLEMRPDIPVKSDEALYVRRSPAVQTIVGIMRILAQSGAATSMRGDERNRYPSAAEIAAMISRYKYMRNRGVDVYDAIDMAINPDTETQDSAIGMLQRHTPSTLISLTETIIHEFIPEHECKAQMAYIAAFQDFVIDWENHGIPTISALLSAWDVKKEKLTVNSGSDLDAVTVMTIHKSKGLEYACIHIPLGSWDDGRATFSQWMSFPAIAGLDTALCPPAIYVELSKNSAMPQSIFYDVCQQRLRDDLTDMLNKTYVAYTRAGRELFVYYTPDKGIAKELDQAFRSEIELTRPEVMLPLAKYYNAETKEFILGEPTHKVCKEEKAGDDEGCKRVIDGYKVHVYDEAEVLTHMANVLDLDPDITDDEEQDTDTEMTLPYIDEESRLRGIVLHDILSHIATRADMDRAISIVAHVRRLPLEKVEEARADIEAMLNIDDTRVDRWFGEHERVLTEQTIYLPDQQRNKRLDRLVFNLDGTVDIVDYKFTTERQSSHKRQVKEYTAILNDMGYERVRAFLWYPFIESRPIIEVK